MHVSTYLAYLPNGQWILFPRSSPWLSAMTQSYVLINIRYRQPTEPAWRYLINIVTNACHGEYNYFPESKWWCYLHHILKFLRIVFSILPSLFCYGKGRSFQTKMDMIAITILFWYWSIFFKEKVCWYEGLFIIYII